MLYQKMSRVRIGVVLSMVVPMLTASAVFGPFAQASYTVSHGRQVLLDRGLQIQGEVAFDSTAGLSNISRFVSSNFTGMNLWANVKPSVVAQLPVGVQWGRGFQPSYNDNQRYLTTAELSYKNSFVSMQYGDELSDVMDPVRQADMKATYAAWNSRYPNALAYTNSNGRDSSGQGPTTVAELTSYVQATRPDMVMCDFYPDYSTFTFSTSERSTWYSVMQRYRLGGLAGYTTDAGVNSGPLPYAQWLDLYRPAYTGSTSALPSESFVRLQQNASWAFGYTFAMAYVYNGTNGWSSAAMFKGPGDSSPTPVFNYVAETNRQSRNLGPALVRLVSTDIRMIPGTTYEPGIDSTVFLSSPGYDVQDRILGCVNVLRWHLRHGRLALVATTISPASRRLGKIGDYGYLECTQRRTDRLLPAPVGHQQPAAPLLMDCTS